MRYLYAVIALALLIVVHELAHLLAARLLRIKVRRFSIGWGPPILAFRRGGMEVTIGAIPLGASAHLHGMNPHEQVPVSDASAFSNRKPWERLVVLCAGSAANYVLALAVLMALHLSGTHVPVPMTIGVVEPGSPAARAQLRPGDLVQSINGEDIHQWSRLVEWVNDSPGQPLTLRILRDGQPLSVEVAPREEDGEGRLGVGQQYVYRELPPGEALKQSIAYTQRLWGEGLELLRRLLMAKGPTASADPIGMVKAASDAASLGLDGFLRVLVSISVALALFYLLPIPALDGGRILFVLFEAITRKRVNPKLETLLHASGFLALLALIAWMAAGDLRKSTSSSPPPSAYGTPPEAGDSP